MCVLEEEDNEEDVKDEEDKKFLLSLVHTWPIDISVSDNKNELLQLKSVLFANWLSSYPDSSKNSEIKCICYKGFTLAAGSWLSRKQLAV